MQETESGEYWNQNAETWTQLARAGFDVYRDALNTPAFFAMLPDVTGGYGLDIGCGEGYNTRLLAMRGAKVSAIDISPIFIQKATELEKQKPLGIEYSVGRAMHLPFGDATFDFATAFMSLMDVPQMEVAIAEAFRVLKAGGFLQFSITHPCFFPPYRRNLRDKNGNTYAIEVGRYFDKLDGAIDEWLFSAAPPELKAGLPKFKAPVFNRTLSEWLNGVVDAGFRIEKVLEPWPTDEIVTKQPHVQDAQIVSYFLHIRCRKP